MKTRFLPIFFFLGFSFSLQAGVIPGRWEKVDVLQQGSVIQLTLKGGGVIRGRFQNSDSDELSLVDNSGSLRSIAKQGVLSVQRPKSRGKSVAIWTAVGAGAGLAVAGVLLASTGGSDETGEVFGLGLVLGAAPGAAIGAVISGPETLYKAPH